MKIVKYETDVLLASTITVALFCTAITFYITHYYVDKAKVSYDDNINRPGTLYTENFLATNTCKYEIKTLSGFHYIRPLMFVDKVSADDKLSTVKHAIETLVDSNKAAGNLSSAGIYLRDLSGNSWIGINENEKFNPGSLLKVPKLITFLKMNECKPGVLDEKFMYDKQLVPNQASTFSNQFIKVGHAYTIRELLKQMIQYTDSNAIELLNKHIDKVAFNKLFADMGLPLPETNDKMGDYQISTRDYSIFMRALYNAAYLSIDDSEYATELLSNTDFKGGLIKDLPKTLQVANKFVDAGENNIAELSESAIVYLNNKTYQITIMTKGANYDKLPVLLAQISNKVYTTMLN
jgi:beta-lactamase class A